MLFLTRGRWRTAATAMTAGALAATTLAFAGAPAQAAELPPPGLNWNISGQYLSHFDFINPETQTRMGTLSATDGATYADDNITWTWKSTSRADGETTVAYEGTVHGDFNGMYSVTVEDPQIVFDGEGTGELTAVVSGNQGAPVTPATTQPARVTVAEFAEASMSERSVSATPAWENVLESGSAEALALDIPSGQPVGGQSFHPDFLAQITPGVRGHFYASMRGGVEPVSNALKPVADFTAVVGPSTQATVTKDGPWTEINLVGEYFTGEGIYATLVPVGTLFGSGASDQQSGLEQMPWTSNIALTAEGAWTGQIAVPTDKLVKGVRYAVYTWSEHSLPTPADPNLTETLISIPGLPKNNSKTVIKLKKKPTTKKKGNARIIVKGVAGVKASGKVKITLKKGKQTKKFTRKLNKKGKASVKLPKLKKGKWKLVAKYTADKNFKKSKKVVKFKVKK